MYIGEWIKLIELPLKITLIPLSLHKIILGTELAYLKVHSQGVLMA